MCMRKCKPCLFELYKGREIVITQQMVLIMQRHKTCYINLIRNLAQTKTPVRVFFCAGISIVGARALDASQNFWLDCECLRHAHTTSTRRWGS